MHRAVEIAERVGRELYARDQAAWSAADALLARFPQAKGELRGYLVSPLDTGWVVDFVVIREGDTEDVKYRIIVPSNRGAPSVSKYESPHPLSGIAATRYQARKLAIQSTRLLCDSSYNVVVLPADLRSETGWLVYLLAASDVPGESIEGHHRILVSPDGSTVLRSDPLSKSCLRRPPPPKSAVAAAITHLVTDTPTEAHVFRNLSSGMPLYVAAGGYLWEVKNGKIIFHGPLGD